MLPGESRITYFDRDGRPVPVVEEPEEKRETWWRRFLRRHVIADAPRENGGRE